MLKLKKNAKLGGLRSAGWLRSESESAQGARSSVTQRALICNNGSVVLNMNYAASLFQIMIPVHLTWMYGFGSRGPLR